MQYSKQIRLGRFGERWGCYGTLPITVVEHELGRMLTHLELRTVIGNWVLTEKVAICNYKNHDIFYGGVEKKGWDEKANPEYHFFVNDLREAVVDVMWCLQVAMLHHKYDVIEWDLDTGSHYVLRIDDEKIVNPDPSLGPGPIASVTPVIM